MPNNTPNNILHLVRHFQNFGEVVFLESQKSDHPSNEKSYIAAKPKAWIKAKGQSIEIFENGKLKKLEMNPWEALRQFSRDQNNWLFGYLGYDLKNSIERLQSNNKSISSAPDLFFMVPSVLIEISKQGEMEALIGEIPLEIDYIPDLGEFTFSEKNRISKKHYLAKIEKAKIHIHEGDLYEINLSHALLFDFKGDPLSLYKGMKEKGPVPFASYICVDGVSICCSSPERFLARRENKVWSQPIKGTISNDQTLSIKEQELFIKSDKNLAENLMIVDLVRNDLSKVAKKGSVRVTDLFEIHAFETVLQMVSTIECEVDVTHEAIDIIEACFPMGSMTGAPKIEVMKVIDELEDYRRGIYSGAIGYITPQQDFDFNVVIRSAIIEKGELNYPVGGAITSDSDPLDEWEETLLKAKALLDSKI